MRPFLADGRLGGAHIASRTNMKSLFSPASETSIKAELVYDPISAVSGTLSIVYLLRRTLPKRQVSHCGTQPGILGS